MTQPVNYHFFMHIPKTAGTTIRHILQQRFDPSRTIPTLNDMKEKWQGQYPLIPDLLNLPEETWRTSQILWGHYYYQVAERFSKPPVCLTMLREPIARSVSMLRHVKRLSRQYRGHSISDLVRNEGLMKRSVANIQTKMLSLRFDLEDQSQWPRDINGPAQLSAGHTEKAKETLKRFEFVGIQERFDESIAMLHDAFGWRLKPGETAASNVGDDNFASGLTEDCLDILRQHNELDTELYEFACGLFATRLEQPRPKQVPA